MDDAFSAHIYHIEKGERELAAINEAIFEATNVLPRKASAIENVKAVLQLLKRTSREAGEYLDRARRDRDEARRAQDEACRARDEARRARDEARAKHEGAEEALAEAIADKRKAVRELFKHGTTIEEARKLTQKLETILKEDQ